MKDQEEYNVYMLEKFNAALKTTEQDLAVYEFYEHTEEMNLCIMALAAMGEG